MPRVPPYAAFFATLALLLPVHVALPLVELLAFPYTLIGLPLLPIALALAAAQRRAMDAHRQRGMYLDVPSTLITSGPFRRSRNPLYLAMVTFTLGFALLLGSAGALLVVLLELAAMTFLGIPYEESVLEDALGDEYRTYRRRVRRWI